MGLDISGSRGAGNDISRRHDPGGNEKKRTKHRSSSNLGLQIQKRVEGKINTLRVVLFNTSGGSEVKDGLADQQPELLGTGQGSGVRQTSTGNETTDNEGIAVHH